MPSLPSNRGFFITEASRPTQASVEKMYFQVPRRQWSRSLGAYFPPQRAQKQRALGATIKSLPSTNTDYTCRKSQSHVRQNTEGRGLWLGCETSAAAKD